MGDRYEMKNNVLNQTSVPISLVGDVCGVPLCIWVGTYWGPVPSKEVCDTDTRNPC